MGRLRRATSVAMLRTHRASSALGRRVLVGVLLGGVEVLPLETESMVLVVLV